MWRLADEHKSSVFAGSSGALAGVVHTTNGPTTNRSSPTKGQHRRFEHVHISAQAGYTKCEATPAADTAVIDEHGSAEIDHGVVPTSAGQD